MSGEGIDYIASSVLERESSEVDFDVAIKDGSNEHFYIKPTYADQYGGLPMVVYGIFNRHTGVMEADTRQLTAAKEWVNALTRITREGPPVPIERELTAEGGTIN